MRRNKRHNVESPTPEPSTDATTMANIKKPRSSMTVPSKVKPSDQAQIHSNGRSESGGPRTTSTTFTPRQNSTNIANSCDGPLPPSPSLTIFVHPSFSNETIPAPMSNMPPASLRSTYFGRLVDICVAQPQHVEAATPVLLDIPRISISALCAMSPVITEAIGRVPRMSVGKVVLPVGNLQAYKSVFAWLDTCIARGASLSFPEERETPLFKYWHVIQIAKMLQISPLLDLAKRFQYMTTYEPGNTLRFPTDDIERAFRELEPGHELRMMMLDRVSMAWLGNDLWAKKRRAIQDIGWQIPEFWDELTFIMNEKQDRQEFSQVRK